MQSRLFCLPTQFVICLYENKISDDFEEKWRQNLITKVIVSYQKLLDSQIS